MSGARLPHATVSVRELVWFLLRHGDLERRGGDPEALAAGARAHALESRPAIEGYEPEVSLKLAVPGERAGEPDILVVGRADAVIAGGALPVLEEIKSTSVPLEVIERLEEPDPVLLLGVPLAREPGDPGGRLLDWAQAICYAAMLAELRTLEIVEVRLRYLSSSGDDGRILMRVYPRPALRAFLRELCRRYGRWVVRAADWARIRDASIRSLELPFPSLRKGQGELVQAAERAVRQGERLFARAPTGMGKTAAVLFAAIRSLPEAPLERVFYLTPRGTTASAPLREVARFREGGLRIRSILLSAREKLCLAPGAGCSPSFCRYARGHNDRILGALEDLLGEEAIDPRVVKGRALAHEVCPHELALDASVWCDLIVGDYNYVFDPRVALRRFQDPFRRGTPDQLYLVDEAHNLLDRAREMYSASLALRELEALARDTEITHPGLARAARELGAALERLAEECDEIPGSDPPAGATGEAPRAVAGPLEALALEAQAWLADAGEGGRAEETEGRLFDVLFFRSTLARFDRRFATLVEADPSGLRVKLCCLDPSLLLAERLDYARSSILFSATLEPIRFYAGALGGGEPAATLSLPSPFPRENLCVLVEASISTRYRERPASVGRLARLIARVARSRAGSYLAFLPSYAYLRAVGGALAAEAPEIELLLQRQLMSEAERSGFMAGIAAPGHGSRVAFAVMGGLFGEAVDLPGEALVGAIVVGPGLPPPAAERELQRSYYEETTGQGFDYAYVYPGISRVLQAAGRVIRGATDRGVVLLVDPRFAEPRYRDLLPAEWDPLPVVQGLKEVEREIVRFWSPV